VSDREAWTKRVEELERVKRIGKVGEQAKNAKLNEDQVIEIRQRASQGESFASIARLFSICDTTARRVALGQKWKHVPNRSGTDNRVTCRVPAATLNAGGAIRKDALGDAVAVSTPAPINAGTASRKTVAGSPAVGMPAPSISLTLPWPPSGNTAVRHTKTGGHYLNPVVVEYRDRVAALCTTQPKLSGQYVVNLVLSPPDKRKRDADNAIKTILDAIKGRLVTDDSMDLMRELHVHVEGQRGDVRLTATAYMPSAA
jgi:crossover junction endodeoxyribonuclease RusA